MTRPVQLSSASVEHYTPQEYADAARETMGSIDLDPASCEAANTAVIRAKIYYDEKENGLAQNWFGNVYLNPPGGTGQIALWWATLADRYAKGLVKQAVFMAFNLEVFRYAQRYDVAHPLDFPVCFPKDRIRFLDPDLKPQKSPAHPSAIVYLGNSRDSFDLAFSKFGRVIK